MDRRGWERFLVVTDSWGAPTAVRIASTRRDAVLGLAMGHAALVPLDRGRASPRARRRLARRLIQLARQGSDAFVRYGIAQMTRGGIDEDTAQRMVERFPDMELVTATLEALGRAMPEPIGDELRETRSSRSSSQSTKAASAARTRGSRTSSRRSRGAETAICPEMCASQPPLSPRPCGNSLSGLPPQTPPSKLPDCGSRAFTASVPKIFSRSVGPRAVHERRNPLDQAGCEAPLPGFEVESPSSCSGALPS